MIPTGFQLYLNDFYETLLGLHTGQVGRANFYLNRLIGHLTELMQELPQEKMTAILPVIQVMLNAKEQDDSVTLADILQHELLPKILGDHFNPSNFNMEILIHLNSLAFLLNEPDGVDKISRELNSIYQKHPQLTGLSSFFISLIPENDRLNDIVNLLRLEQDAGRLTPENSYKLALLLAKQKEFGQAIQLMEAAYSQNENLKDGFVQIGWLKAGIDGWHEALSLATRDESTNRLSFGSEWTLKLAQLYTHCDNYNHALHLVERTYAENPVIQNGYANIALIIADKSQEWQEAYKLMDSDLSNNRLNPVMKKKMSVIAANLELWDQAEILVADAYNSDMNLCNGYARLGWIGYLQGKGKQFFINYMDHERSIKRFSYTKDVGALFKALEAVLAGNPYESIFKQLSEASKKSSHNRNWFCVVGWLYILNGSFREGLSMMRHDFEADLMDSRLWFASFIIAMLLAGETENARKCFIEEYSAQGIPDKDHIGYISSPDAELTAQELKVMVFDTDRSLIYSALEKRFKEAQH